MNSDQINRLLVAASDGPTLQIGGFTVTYKIASEATAGAVAVVEHTLAPGKLGAAMHRHQHEDEISYVVEGRLGVQVGDKVVTAEAGMYVFKPRGIFHTFWNNSDEMVRFVEIISPGGFEHYFEALAPLVPADAPPDVEGIMALAQRYGLEFEMDSLPTIMATQGVRLE